MTARSDNPAPANRAERRAAARGKQGHRSSSPAPKPTTGSAQGAVHTRPARPQGGGVPRRSG